MEGISRSSVRELLRRVVRVVRDLDPRTVKLRDPRPRIRPWLAVAAVGTALVAGAAALAATGEDPNEDDRNAPGHGTRAPDRATLTGTGEDESGAGPVDREPPPVPRHPNFHDPVYVFTDGQVERVSAYPMADPPGVVVNLDGAPEPTASPESMVGEDSRIRAIRRRVTDKGVRYVIGLTIPLKRIDVIHEGNVVIITPVR